MNPPINYIKDGEQIMVEVSPGFSLKGTLLSKPAATGDCWIIRIDDGRLVYVQNFQAIFQEKAT